MVVMNENSYWHLHGTGSTEGLGKLHLNPKDEVG